MSWHVSSQLYNCCIVCFFVRGQWVVGSPRLFWVPSCLPLNRCFASNHVASGSITSHPVGSGVLLYRGWVWWGIPIRSCHVSSGLVRFSPVWSRQAGVCIVFWRVGILSCRVMSYSIRSCPVLSWHVLFCIVGVGEGILSQPVMSRPVASCHVRSHGFHVMSGRIRSGHGSSCLVWRVVVSWVGGV